MNPKTSVGELRNQTAFCNSDRKVIITSKDPTLKDLEVVRFYPDTTDENGELNSTFKIEVKRRE